MVQTKEHFLIVLYYLQFDLGLCPATPDCGFEDEVAGACQYTQDPTDDFDWKRGTGAEDGNDSGKVYYLLFCLS